MHINTFLKVTVLALGVVCLSSCSTTKSKNGPNAPIQDGAQTTGFGSINGFNADGALNPNRLKAPYDQVYYFAFNKYDVNSEDVASVNVQANYLTTHSTAKIRLEGNADERGSREYNIALGWKRAKAVAAILQQQGVAPSQIAMVSYGKEKPVAFGHDEEAYQLNRRVNLIYEAK